MLMNWIVKTICVSGDGTILKSDPYYACPNGSAARNIQLGDALPYNNYEQMGYQICDSFSLLDKMGKEIFLHTFDYYPFNEFNQHSGSDGYDIYDFLKGVLSVTNTKDGGGYGSTFYGDHCQFGNGWVLFPTDNFIDGGEGYWPIAGVYWERKTEEFPGSCPTGYSRNTLTIWEPVTTHDFGGINGNTVKTMQTLVSYHGFETDDGATPTDSFLQQGHLEVFYYTMEYGLTMWEVWTPMSVYIQSRSMEQLHIAASNECSGPENRVFKGLTYTVTDCHDWSNVQFINSSGVLQWPLVNSNLLRHSHFVSDDALSDDESIVGLWHRFGLSADGHSVNWVSSVSTGGSDGSSGSGVAFLAMNCGASAGSNCGPPGSQAIYQDVLLPLNTYPACAECSYLYGVNVRTEIGTGSLSIAVQLLDDNNYVVWQDLHTDANILSDNGDGRGNESASVYLSAKFISKSVKFPVLDIEVSKLRFLIIPNDPTTFNILDGFLNVFSVAN